MFLIGAVAMAFIVIIVGIVAFFAGKNMGETEANNEFYGMVGDDSEDDSVDPDAELYEKINTILDNEGETQSEIDQYFDEKLKNIGEDNYDERIAILANKVNALVYGLKNEEALKLVEEMEKYPTKSIESKIAICEAGVLVASEMENIELYEKYDSQCEKIYNDNIGELE